MVLAGQVPGEVLAAASRSLNVTLYRPEAPAAAGGAEPQTGSLQTAAAALRRAGRATAPYALVPADPLAAVAARWREMWDLTVQPGPAAFEQEAALALAAWRAGQFELPDYYLVLAAEPSPPGTLAGDEDSGSAPVPDFYLGPLRAARPHRVVLVPATEPAEQAAGVLHALGSLRHGPWWPDLDQLIEAARGFYPGSLGATEPVTLAGSRAPAG